MDRGGAVAKEADRGLLHHEVILLYLCKYSFSYLPHRVSFDYVLLNLYRNGKDSISPHSDGEALGRSVTTGQPRNIIASISLGETRRFVLQHKTKKEVPRVEYELPSGSLLIMAGRTQVCISRAFSLICAGHHTRTHIHAQPYTTTYMYSLAFSTGVLEARHPEDSKDEGPADQHDIQDSISASTWQIQ